MYSESVSRREGMRKKQQDNEYKEAEAISRREGMRKEWQVDEFKEAKAVSRREGMRKKWQDSWISGSWGNKQKRKYESRSDKMMITT